MFDNTFDLFLSIQFYVISFYENNDNQMITIFEKKNVSAPSFVIFYNFYHLRTCCIYLHTHTKILESTLETFK